MNWKLPYALKQNSSTLQLFVSKTGLDFIQASLENKNGNQCFGRNCISYQKKENPVYVNTVCDSKKMVGFFFVSLHLINGYLITIHTQRDTNFKAVLSLRNQNMYSTFYMCSLATKADLMLVQPPKINTQRSTTVSALPGDDQKGSSSNKIFSFFFCFRKGDD